MLFRSEGYLKICAVLQKFIDQGISVNTSYNPKHFDDDQVPLSVLIKDILLAYRWGIKQLYYNNTLDGAGEIEVENKTPLNDLPPEEDCLACKI